jgi:hypothetical protein
LNKEQLHKEMSEIDFPREEVFAAIKGGIAMGRKSKKPKRRITFKRVGLVSTVAASAFLASGLIFAPVSNVLAAVPLVGGIYEKFGLQIGYELLESDLITQLNQQATSNGVNITLTSAYYDGNVIGITFTAKGERVSLATIGDKGPETGYNFHLFDGKEKNQWAASMTQLTETEDGYAAAMEFYHPSTKLPKDYTLPLTFTSVTGTKGVWKFDVPVEQIASETIYSDANGEQDDYSLTMESVVKGKATTLINYQTTFPLEGAEDDIRITVFDNEGNRLTKNHPEVLSTKENVGLVEKEIRELFSSKINEKAKFLTLQPEIIRYEEDTVATLGQSTPIIVESDRFDYSIKVNSVKQKGNKLILDYDIQNVDTDVIREDIIDNFAEFIMLINTEDIQRDNQGKLNMGDMLEDRVRSTSVKVLGNGPFHYQSTFTIAEKIDVSDYSITVPFGTLSANSPIKMEPIKVNLK